MKSVKVVCYSDVLCVWAYISQLRLDEVAKHFGEKVHLEQRHCAVFGDTERKIGIGWKDRGGYDGFNAHVREAASHFPEVELNAEVWRSVRPASSSSAHTFLAAVRLAEGNEAAARLARDVRRAFFADSRDISRIDVQFDVARNAGFNADRICGFMDDGRAHAALASDYEDAAKAGVQGSPTLVLNEGRQKLHGNVGYRVIEANIQELLREPEAGEASWC